MNLRSIATLSCTAVLLILGCHAPEHSATLSESRIAVDPLLPDQPGLNVIVISFDALRADVLGVYGSARGATPHMDAFAEQSLLFQNAYTVAPVTPTSFAAAWSGFLPSRVFLGWRFRAPETMAGLLSAAGYETKAVVNNVQLTPERDFDRGFEDYSWHRNDPDGEILRAAEGWLAKPHDAPFFLWVHFLVPHAPYRALQQAQHLYRTSATGRFAKTSGNRFQTSDPAEIARLHDLYLGAVWRADQLFGALLKALRSAGLFESSIVVLTSDHGEEFGEHGGFQHGRVYEEHLRIPLVVHHPKMTARTVSQRVRNVDLMPTILRAVGSPVTGVLDGRVIPRSGSAGSSPVVGISMTGAEKRWVSLLVGSKKAILACGPDRGLEMYDLATDPAEQRDLASADRRGSRELLATLRTLLGGSPCEVIDRAARGKAETVGLDDESIDALRSLGYLN